MADSAPTESSLRDEIHRELAAIRLIDPHTHINPHQPASTTLADILGYHYYTELAHSAGMPKAAIEEPNLAPKELVGRLVENLQPLENTAQYRWLIEICRMFFGFDEDRLNVNNWEPLYERSESIMGSAQWPQVVLDQSNVQSVFLTNDFDDALSGFDTDTYIPCLRTDDLVFHLAKPDVRGRLADCSGVDLDGSLESLRASLRQRFEHFVAKGARACAISLPPSFTPTPVADGRASTALDAVLRQGLSVDASHRDALSRRVFWTLAELCDEFGLPFDLMIGVNRGVYADGVYQGQDLFDSRVSLIQYRELFNAFPNVKFPVSVLASVTNQELVSYAWIFPNVITNGHWWYSNTPSTIARDAANRLEAVPQTKQIGYYSDAYRLEFVWPKFDMYRRVLAGVLADQFVRDQRWSVDRALELGRRVLRDNVDEIFPRPANSTVAERPRESADGPLETATPVDESVSLGSLITGGSAMAAGVAIVAEGLAGDDIDHPTVQDESAEAETGDEEESSVDDTLYVEEWISEKIPTDEREPELISDDAFDTKETTPESSDAGDDESASLETLIEEEDLGNAGFDIPVGTSAATVIEHGNDVAEMMAEVDPEATLADLPTVFDRPADGDADVVTEMQSDQELAIESPEDISKESMVDELIAAPEDVGTPDASVEIDDESGDVDASDESDLGSLETLADFNDATIDVPETANPDAVDPLPHDDELSELDIDDVELADSDSNDLARQDLLADMDPEPLDVGDLLDDADTDSVREEAKIQPLTGEASFNPDEETLQLQPDPTTGELTFPTSAENQEANDDDEFDWFGDEDETPSDDSPDDAKNEN